MEVIGFAARAYCEERTDELPPYATQFILILIAPALMAASVYMALSRLIRKLKAESQSIISARWMTRLFVLGDVLSFLIQLGGGAIATNPDADPMIAKWAILIGLLLQIAFFALFIVTALIFHKRMRNWQSPGPIESMIRWKWHMMMLYIVSGLIMVRSIFRVIEYAMGFDSYLFVNEWPLYVFDAALMFIAMVVWCAMYPGELNMSRRNQKLPEEVPM